MALDIITVTFHMNKNVRLGLKVVGVEKKNFTEIKVHSIEPRKLFCFLI